MFAEAVDGKSTNTVNIRVNSSRNPANVNVFPLPDTMDDDDDDDDDR